jgi:hypothetical protein
MGKEFLRMQMLAGVITEGQYKQLLEDEETINRILDKISDQGMDSLTPEEKAYLDKNSKGEKDIEAPIHYIKLNLPKDINSPETITIWSQKVQDEEEEEKLTDIIDELIELNPQINPKLFKNSYGLYNDVIDDVEEGTKKEILYSYFYWLFRNLAWDIDKYSEKEANERADKYADLADEFRDKAMQGQWMVVSGVTDNDHANTPNKKLIDPNHRDSNDLWGDLGA